MYKEFFGLKEPPFNLTPDPRFFYMSRRHQEALASLIYGVKERKGFILLTGEIGAGKTTLCRTFLNELNSETTNVALVLNSYLNDVELLQTINDEFGIDSASTSKKQFIDELNKYLLAEADKGKTSVIIIDEAQNLSPTVLEQVRMLSNLETESCKLVQIVLMGQPELGRILAQPELEQLNQRIMVRCHIGPLDKQEIYHYIRHRLQVAGARINVTINAAALNRIFHCSKGIPRRINVLCDRALLAAYVAGQFWIDAPIIATAEKELITLGVRGGKTSRSSGFLQPAVIFIAFTACVLFGGAIGAVWFALNMDRFFQINGAGMKELSAAPRRTDAIAPPAVSDRPVAAASAGAFSEAASESTTKTLESAAASTSETLIAEFTSSTLSVAEEWTYDADGIARVSDPDLAYMASLLTISKLWRLPVKMDEFPSYGKETLLGINLHAVFNGSQMNLRSFETSSGLRQAMEFDLPLVLNMNSTSARLSPSVVLLRSIGEKCVLGDPHFGRIEMPLSLLEGQVERVRVFYMDSDNLALMLYGENSGKVARLRTFLAEQGMWSGRATWVFDDDVKESLKRFQNACNLAATGRMDGPTAACIAARKQAFRPRLLQVSDAK